MKPIVVALPGGHRPIDALAYLHETLAEDVADKVEGIIVLVAWKDHAEGYDTRTFGEVSLFALAHAGALLTHQAVMEDVDGEDDEPVAG
jgi:hypothetical protein